ncbi:MAG: hypothetical protein Q8L48_11690 [Archangium sp.]|nr:hypothetical protein [Archangium sp.]
MLFGVSCANLGAVRKFAKTSAATADYEEVVADYVGSPRRLLRYQPEDQQDALKKSYETRKAQQPRLKAVQQVLVGYMDALGDLAADEVPGIDDEVDAFSKALDGAGFIGDGDQKVGKETATAATAIAKLLGRAILDGWRQAKLKKMVEEGDKPLQTAVAGLKGLLGKDLRASLENESVAVQKPFKAWTAAATSSNDPDGAPPVARILLDEHLEAVRARQRRLESYLQVLDAIAEGHAELVTNIERLDRDEVTKKLDGYTKNLKATYAAMDALTKQ